MAAVYDEKVPQTVSEKKAFLLDNHVAVWDVIKSCDIEGSSDSSIKNVTANDLNEILGSADIKAIYVNGKTAQKYYKKYTEPILKREAVCLPSTSPANAAWSLERLKDEWKALILTDEKETR